MTSKPRRKGKSKWKRLLIAFVSIFFLCIIACIIVVVMRPQQTIMYILHSDFVSRYCDDINEKININEISNSDPGNKYIRLAVQYLEELSVKPILPTATFYGIDVSSHQGNIKWNDVAINYDFVSREITNKNATNSRKIDFAIAKATEGKTFTDSYLSDNRDGIRQAGIVFGAYHYFSLNSSPEEQALHFIRKCGLRNGDMVPILDFEETGKLDDDELRRRVLTWLRIVGEHFNCKPIIYTNSKLRTKLLATSEFDNYDFWIAQWYVTRPKCDFTLWQFTDNGRSSGIKGRVDMNAYFADRADFQKLLLQ